MNIMKLKFEDTNLALLGSLYEKLLREKCANEEPEWHKIKSEPSFYIWRIEKFNVVPWPLDQYGTFYQGDTYIILNITSKNDTLEYKAHMWVGKDSSTDESGTGAYKIVELDDFFKRKVTLIYEPQGNESKLFKSYFKTIIILEGGIDTGFKKVEVAKYRPRLLHVQGTGSCVHSTEVPFTINSMNSNDVFIIDDGLTIINWRGAKSSSFEKFNGTTICEKLKSDRNGKPVIKAIDQGDTSDDIKKYFVEYNNSNITDDKVGTPSDMVIGCYKKMMKLSDSNGKLEMTNVEYSKQSLKSEDAFLIDRGDNIFIWVGKGASKNEKRFGLIYAKKYQNQEKRNLSLPILVVQEGQLQGDIDLCFN